MSFRDNSDMETTIWQTFDGVIQHGIIVSKLAYLLSKKLRMEQDLCHDMAVAGMMHEIGKLKIQSYLARKYDNILEIDEIRYIRMYPSTGYIILKEQKFNDRILSAVLTYHESYDGSGYPMNLKGMKIPIEGRILHVCDCFGTMVSNHDKKEPFDLQKALDFMIAEFKKFDMRIYVPFQEMACSEEFKDVLRGFGLKLKK